MRVWKLDKLSNERQFNMAVTDKQEGSLQMEEKISRRTHKYCQWHMFKAAINCNVLMLTVKPVSISWATKESTQMKQNLKFASVTERSSSQMSSDHIVNILFRQN
jgi:hypothetical protein